MKRIAGHWAAAFAWVSLLPLLLRDADPDGAVFSYLFACVSAIGVVVVPALRHAPIHQSLLPLFALFLVSRAGYSSLFGGQVPWAIETVYLLGTLGLARRLGRILESADAAIEMIGSDWATEQVASFEESQGEIYREIRRARRYERPASLVALSVAASDERNPDELMREVQQALTQRYADGQVAKLLLEETDAAALITRRNSHFVVLLPEVDAARARHLILRLGNTVAARWKLRLCAGSASFPDQEVTFEGLLERAESELGAQRRAPSPRRTGVEPEHGRSRPALVPNSRPGNAAPHWPES